MKSKDLVIGYSGFDTFEECYSYFENSCFIADTAESADQFMRNSYFSEGEYRIEPVAIQKIMNDYGCSCGDYAMEKKAFDRFIEIAKASDIGFDSHVEEYEDQLIIVNVEGVNLTRDQ
jgi:hypothetical protein